MDRAPRDPSATIPRGLQSASSRSAPGAGAAPSKQRALPIGARARRPGTAVTRRSRARRDDDCWKALGITEGQVSTGKFRCSHHSTCLERQPSTHRVRVIHLTTPEGYTTRNDVWTSSALEDLLKVQGVFLSFAKGRCDARGSRWGRREPLTKFRLSLLQRRAPSLIAEAVEWQPVQRVG